MAQPPQSVDELIEVYGPKLNFTPRGGWEQSTHHAEDRLVKTHCCFCGQQCGIQLRVRDNAVVGFEPWEDFPFNQGMLCPKGVKRYLQGSHPDRLLDPLIRTNDGFRKASWEEAMETTVRRLREIQERNGPDAVAVLGGASLISEKTYLLGKFARLALGTRHIDYNGRLCMVSAGTAYKMVFGADRNPNPWSDIPQAQVVIVAGSNVAECFPITTDYLWRMRDNGGKLIVADPRRTPITRNADLYLPVKPGMDTVLFSGILHVILREGWEDRTFIEAHTTGFEAVAESVRQWDPRRTAEATGVPPESIEKAALWFGTAERAMALHARGVEHHSHGVENVLSIINLCLATGNIGRPGAGPNMITGQGNGQGGREHGQKCDQLPGQRHIEDPAARAYVAKVWGVPPESLPHQGLSAMEIFEAIHRGEIKGLLSICFNQLVSLPDAGYIREALNRLEFFGVIDFFLSETAHHADVVLAGSLHEEEEGVVCSGEGRVIKINKAVNPPGNARGDSRILVDLARLLGKGEYFQFPSTREIFEEMRVATKGGTADYSGITWERLEREMGLFWPVPSEDHPGTPRLFEGGHFKNPDGKARFVVAEVRPPGDPLDSEYPLYLTTGRVVSQFLSGTQTRRIGPLVAQYPEPLVELHPELASLHGIANGDWVTVTTRRTSVTLPAMVVRTIRPDTVFIPYHWPGRKSANNLTHRTLDPRSKIPEFKNSACRIARAEEQPALKTQGRSQLPVLGGR
jgi:assimilatory nitrate reductase catalytic subunit